MFHSSAVDVAIWAVAAYISLMTLVRLLRYRRDQVVARYQTLVLAASRRKAEAERQRKRRDVQRSSMKPPPKQETKGEPEQTKSPAAA